MVFITILGWVGSISYLAGYFLLTTKKISANRPFFHILNIIGAIGLVVNAVHFKDYPNVAVNIVWGIIALVAILAMRPKIKG